MSTTNMPQQYPCYACQKEVSVKEVSYGVFVVEGNTYTSKQLLEKLTFILSFNEIVTMCPPCAEKARAALDTIKEMFPNTKDWSLNITGLKQT